VSNGYVGKRVKSAKRLASVDFPPPAFPNTAIVFMCPWALVERQLELLRSG
jgi:hypothetical protein